MTGFLSASIRRLEDSMRPFGGNSPAETRRGCFDASLETGKIAGVSELAGRSALLLSVFGWRGARQRTSNVVRGGMQIAKARLSLNRRVGEVQVSRPTSVR